MRKFNWGKEIRNAASTCFNTNSIALQSILVHKDDLRTMVTSREWISSTYAKDTKGKKFVKGVEVYFLRRMCNGHVDDWTFCSSSLNSSSDNWPSLGHLNKAIHCSKI